MYSNYSTIPKDKLYIEKLKEYLKDKETLYAMDVIEFYKKFDPEIKATTVIWRIYSLVQMGILNRVGRGKLAVGKENIYLPVISPKIKSLYTKLKKEFPYLKICLWNTSSFNEFMIHQPGRFYILIEVEKEATQSVFFFLKERKYSVFIEPSNDLIDKYLPDEKETLIVKLLVTEAPLQIIKGIQTVTIEKMLVDIFCDYIIFSAQQGSEMRIIFNEAMNKYSVNKNRMLRYANRRGKKKIFTDYLNSISDLGK